MSDQVGPKYVNPTKKYGLILPKRDQPVAKAIQRPLKLAAFDEDDDLDEEETATTKYKVNTNESRLKKQTQLNIEKALEEDPDIFEYDSIHDQLKEEKVKSDAKARNQSKEPKYIAGLMKAAAVRQMEFEKRQDRKIQKEREEEGDMFGDKEAFVTEAYRKRMEEMKRLEEEERKQDQIEALLDVKKAKDLSGFYDSMLKIATGEMVIEEEGEKMKRLERERKEREELERKEKEKETFAKKVKEAAEKSKAKSYRSRKEEESSEEEEDATVNAELLPKTEAAQDDDEEISDEEEEKPVEPKAKKLKVEEGVESEEEKVVEKKPVVKIETKEERWKRLFTKRNAGQIVDKQLAEYFERRNDLLSKKLYIERE